MQKLHNTHPIEALLLVAMAAVWAVWTIARAVLVPTIALVLTLADRRPPAPAEPAPPAPAPMPHPLIELAEAVAADLATSTVAELRRLARNAGLPRQLAREALAEEAHFGQSLLFATARGLAAPAGLNLGLRKAYSRILWEQLEENSWATRQSSWHRQGRPRGGPSQRERVRLETSRDDRGRVQDALTC